jgi:hypothetical protein
MSTYESNRVPIEKLSASLECWIDRNVVDKYFQELFKNHGDKWRNDLKNDHWKSSIVRKILQVHERILFTDFLFAQIDERFETRLYYPQLITYLRLTCFDQLGQPTEWYDFKNWLKSKKLEQKSDKEKILQSITSQNPIEIGIQLFDGYQKIFGNKNSFSNFINSVITNDQRIKLLGSIEIKIYDAKESSQNDRDVKDSDKLNYLYRIRNDYTHNIYNKDPISKINQEEKLWNHRERIKDGKNELWISTKFDFQQTLKDTVLNGIAQRIKNNYGM